MTTSISRRAWTLAAVGLILLGLASAAPQKSRRKPQALIAGTVFTETGHSLPGAMVVVENQSDDKQRAEGKTDRRGEFAIRVPAGKASYRITAAAKGFKPQQKVVEIYDREKVTAMFVLSPL